MSDDIKIGLDGKPLIDAAKPITDALGKIDSAVDRLASNKSIERMNRSARGELGALAAELKALQTQMGQFVGVVNTSLQRAAREAQPTAKAAGKAFGKEIVEGLENEVRKAQIRISAPRMVLPNGLMGAVSGKGENSIQSVMDTAAKLMSETGARMTSQIQAEQAALREAQKISNDTYRSRLNWQKALDKDAQASAKSQAAALLDAQRTSNETFRSRLNWQKSVDREARAGAKAESEALREAQRVSNDTYRARMSYAKATAAAETAAQREAQKVSNDTYRARMNYLRAEDAERKRIEAERQRAAAAANSGTNLSASFNAASVTSQLRRATTASNAMAMGMSEADAIKRYGAAAVEAAGNLRALEAAQARTATGSKALAEEQRNVHSAMRGVAGAANALFLTYGALVPLTTAFLAASSVREAIKNYKDLEYQIKFVKALSDEGLGGSTASEVRSRLGATAADAGYDPLEAAKGMRLLAQSGLEAQEALTALPVVLKVATVGELDVANATETLTGAVHAFGLELSDMERVGDVLAKAGAISNTSVERMAESMKQASTVAEQFHLSIEDASTAMVVLAKRNITGSAAGTSLTNMMRDLANPHGRAKKAATAIGFDAFDTSTGETKDLFGQILPELRAKLKDFAPKAQKQLIADLTNNRGEKLLAALLGATDGELAEIRNKLTESKGFVAKANEELMDSVEGDLRRLRATLDSSLAEAGAAGSAQLRSSLQQLRDVVASPEFIGAISALVKGFTALMSVVVKAIDLLAGPAGYAAAILGLGAVAGPVLSTVGRIVPLAGQAGTALATIGTAAGTAAGGAGALVATLARFGAVGLAVGAAGTAVYLLYNALTNKGVYETAASNIDTIIKKQQDYYNSLVKSNNELARQIGLQGAGKATDNTARSNYADARSKYDKDWGNFDIAGARARLSAARGQPGFMQKGFNNLEGQINRYDEATRNLEKVRQKATQSIGLEYATGEEERRQRQLQIEQAKKHAKDMQNALGNGGANGKGYSSDSDRGAAAAARRAADEDWKNEKKRIDLISAGNKLLVDQVDTEAKARQDAIQQGYDRGVTDFKTYQDQMSQAQQEQATIRINLAEAESSAIKKGLADLTAKAEAQKKAGKADVDDALTNEIQAQTNKYLQAQNTIAKLVSEQKAFGEKQLTEALKPASEILKNAEKESAVEDERMRQELEKLRVKGSGLELSEREQFIQAEILRIMGEQEKKLSGAQAIMRQMTEDGAFKDADTNPEVRAVRDRLQGYIDSKRSTIDAARPAIAQAAGDTFDGKRWTNLAQQFSNTLEGSIKGALTAGLTGDTSAMQNFGESLKKTIVTSLVDAFYEAFLSDSIKGLAKSLVGSLRGGSSGAGAGVSLIGGSLSTGGGAGGSSVWGTLANTGKALAGLFGFDGGGYTGNGGKYEPKGVVHGGEFVINKESTSKLGLDFLNGLNQFADGGYVPMTAGPSLAGNPAGRISSASSQQIVFSPTTSIHVDSRSDRAAVIADVQRVVAESQRNYTEQLKRVKVLPA